MSRTVLKVEHLSKSYRLGTIGTGTLSHDINRAWSKLRSKEDPFLKIGSKINKEQTLLALDDISFEVQEGQVFGIIGRNGAGKSTLLKILSKITSPTSGQVYIKGKVSSLLEVGTGFHPEMTGRENVFMNGAILGMKSQEISSKFDEIVSFAGVEKFIDTPVKRYSSGMYLKLAFAVAAHLEPDILILDEVLAVGDAEFQKKCLGKMKEVSSEGRTVLFVSHNMAAIQSITKSAMILEHGKIKFIGDTKEAVSMYMKGSVDCSNYRKDLENILVINNFIIKSIAVKSVDKDYTQSICRDDKIEVGIEYINKNDADFFDITIRIKADDGQYVLTSSTIQEEYAYITKGYNKISMFFPAYFFNYETYYVDLLLVSNKKTAILIENDIVSFTVQSEQKKLGDWMGKTPGYLYTKLDWENKPNTN